MAEAMPKLDYPPPAATPLAAPARAANGAPLRWTPGPDELRLPCSEDDPVPQNTRQTVAIVDCFDSLRLRWRGRPDVFAGSDQFVYWDEEYDPKTKSGNPPLAPDVYVVFGVANRHRKTYVVWEERKPPDFVLEVVSPSTRRRDEVEKPKLYARMGVPEFFRYDPEGKLDPALAGFELPRRGRRTYRPLPTERFAEDVVGTRSNVLGVCLCVRRDPEPMVGAVVCYDPAAGRFLPTLYDLDEKAETADARADASDAEARAAVARADAADARADAMAAELAAVKAQIKKTRSERE